MLPEDIDNLTLESKIRARSHAKYQTISRVLEQSFAALDGRKKGLKSCRGVVEERRWKLSAFPI